MRELPEVEVLRRDLERALPGRTVAQAEVTGAAELVHAKSKKAFADSIVGARIVRVDRCGLALLVHLEDTRTLVVRLGASGLVRRGGVAPATPADVTLALDAGPPVTLHGLADGGGLWLVEADQLDDQVPDRRTGGFDPLDDPLPWARFGNRLGARHEPLRRVLLDPTFVLGLGDCVVDEALFEAGVRHDRRADSLSSQEIRRLYRSLIEVIHDAVKHRGTSLGEAPFVDLAGKRGDHAEHLQVHGRDGKRSPRSRTPVRRVKFEGRVTYFCDTQV